MAASATASAAVTGVADNFSTGRRPVLHQHHQCQALFILTAKFLRRSCFGAGVLIATIVKKLLGRRGQFSVEEDEKRMMLAVTDAQLPNPPPPKHTGIKVQSIGEGGSTI
mmetsp:Transcript_23092/g.50127  ORF Transcript_23092/g.50127 Transcript_23092/m.50127 type:complete len:110 (-) Transcript_23092:172-501(-)